MKYLRPGCPTLAVKSGNNKIIYQLLVSSALADETNDLSMPCHEHRTGADTVGLSSLLCLND